jgi:hypothetical protein
VYELVGNKGIYATTELPIESQVSELPPDGIKPGVQRVHEMPGVTAGAATGSAVLQDA